MNEMKVWKGDRLLRCGFTTGSCAAAAAKAATWMLLTGKTVDYVEIITPKGIPFRPLIEQIQRFPNQVSCSVKKDGGDDPDVTHGLFITATVEVIPEIRIEIDGGAGVGRVTRSGLDQPIGAAAINRVPRKMIADGVMEVLSKCATDCGIRVMISVEGGEERALQTFNPRLGIIGGISILGTSGVVMPMSEKALIDTIRVDVKAQIAQGNGYVIGVPGNHGLQYCNEQIDIEEEHIVICSNYIGETIDAAVEYGAKGLLLVGHLGKFVKLAAGIMNTHSREADGRMEILAAHVIQNGGSIQTATDILQCGTTDEAIRIIDDCDLRNPVMESLLHCAESYLKRRAYETLEIGLMIYSFQEGCLGATANTSCLIEKIKLRGNKR